ncbi:uncharacterized protein PV09_04321 [Verruconis gallopava]|uniref:Uncharacterized protein n=1 Tax=Verruconis gallopava TaxID=253628 RepID=A0A0D1XPU7_9PEZI|nr:uncharacterized protein PV09_04321 [Verruconis gallopava]KIW04571.1 hypothetical protein PV09_04321 [Verruconis gallopava]
MSAESFAAFRRHHGTELGKLAEAHWNKDLQQEDREILQAASQRFQRHAMIGSIVGIGLGVLLAARVRSARLRMFNTFKAQEKPTAVQFADGRIEKLPDLTNLVKPTVLGDIAAYFFFTAGGLFVGGETGLLTGSMSAGRLITRDPSSRERIEAAFRKFRADMLRQEADKLDSGGSLLSKVF